MVRIDLDLENLASVEESLQDLEDRWTTDTVYVTGTNVEYAIYLEMGTRDMPPYPWFRPAILEFEADPEGFIRDTTDFKSIDAIPSADALVKAVAFGLVTKMQANVDAGSANLDRSPGTHPEHPKRQTSNLINSIGATRIS